MYKNLYISITLHLIVLYLLLSGNRDIIQNTGTLTINKEVIITAEIVTEKEFENKKKHGKTIKKKLTSPVTIFSNAHDNEKIKNSENFPSLHLSNASVINLDEVKSYLETGNINIWEPIEISKNKTNVENLSPYYGKDPIKIIRDSIEKAKVYPLLARKKGIEGKVILRFRIKPNGEVEDVRILKSSGFEILDKTSIETIKRAAPLPYMRDWIEIPLVFRLE